MNNCLLCGVGGQGTVLASRVIASAAMAQGLFARTAETIGMAQRGGSVVSHVRVGESVPSPLIPSGKADVIIGFEPGEAVRNLSYLKQGGTVIVADRGVAAVAEEAQGNAYSPEKMLEYLKANTEKCIVVEVGKIIDECGSARVMNVALMGALAKTGIMGLELSDITSALEKKVKPQFLEMNKKALLLGAECV